MPDDYNPSQYLPTIDAILSVADLEKITVKKIRNALQELFGVNLTEHKQNINEVILERYYDLAEKRKNDQEPPQLTKEEIERQDALLAAKLSKSAVHGPITRHGNKRSKPPLRTLKASAHPKRAPVDNNFNKAMYLSEDLQNLFGVELLPRPQIVKQLWIYIKDKNLQNPNDRRQILCDATLQKIFKKKTVGIFEMNKLLSAHIFKPDEIGDQQPAQLQAKPTPESSPSKSKANGKKKSADFVNDEDDEDDDDDDDGDLENLQDDQSDSAAKELSSDSESDEDAP